MDTPRFVQTVDEATEAVLAAKGSEVLLSAGTVLHVKQLNFRSGRRLIELTAEGLNLKQSIDDLAFRAEIAQRGADGVFYAANLPPDELAVRAEASAAQIDTVFEKLSMARRKLIAFYQELPGTVIWACSECTGQTEAFFEELGFADILNVAKAVLEVNIGQFSGVKDFLAGATSNLLGVPTEPAKPSAPEASPASEPTPTTEPVASE